MANPQNFKLKILKFCVFNIFEDEEEAVRQLFTFKTTFTMSFLKLRLKEF